MVLQEIPNVPPVIQLLLNEINPCSTRTDARKRIREILPELKLLAKSYKAPTPMELKNAREPGELDIHLHGALDIIAGRGCVSLNCRTSAADRIARSVGLLADKIWVTDTITEKLLYLGRANKEKIEELLDTATILSRWTPLIASGLVRFRSPHNSTCEKCAEKIHGHISPITSEITRKFKDEFSIESYEDGGFYASMGQCFEPPTFMSFWETSERPDLNEFTNECIKQEIFSILHVAREAAITGGSLFSNSRLGLAALLQKDGRLKSKQSMILLESEREINFPWVSELNPQQIVELRQEASSALPSFRTHVSRIFSDDPLKTISIADTIESLRYQAAEVRAELNAGRKNSAKYWNVTYGLLGLGLSAYGLSAHDPSISIGGLLPLIDLMISHKSGHEKDISAISRQPGYVLMKAQDILAHAH